MRDLSLVRLRVANREDGNLICYADFLFQLGGNVIGAESHGNAVVMPVAVNGRPDLRVEGIFPGDFGVVPLFGAPVAAPQHRVGSRPEGVAEGTLPLNGLSGPLAEGDGVLNGHVHAFGETVVLRIDAHEQRHTGGNGRTNGLDTGQREPGAVLQTAAVCIGAVVETVRQEAIPISQRHYNAQSESQTIQQKLHAKAVDDDSRNSKAMQACSQFPAVCRASLQRFKDRQQFFQVIPSLSAGPARQAAGIPSPAQARSPHRPAPPAGSLAPCRTAAGLWRE